MATARQRLRTTPAILFVMVLPKKPAFNKVEFRTNVFPYKGSDKWVEPTLVKIKACLKATKCQLLAVAAMGSECEYYSLPGPEPDFY